MYKQKTNFPFFLIVLIVFSACGQNSLPQPNQVTNNQTNVQSTSAYLYLTEIEHLAHCHAYADLIDSVLPMPGPDNWLQFSQGTLPVTITSHQVDSQQQTAYRIEITFKQELIPELLDTPLQYLLLQYPSDEARCEPLVAQTAYGNSPMAYAFYAQDANWIALDWTEVGGITVVEGALMVTLHIEDESLVMQLGQISGGLAMIDNLD